MTVWAYIGVSSSSAGQEVIFFHKFLSNKCFFHFSFSSNLNLPLLSHLPTYFPPAIYFFSVYSCLFTPLPFNITFIFPSLLSLCFFSLPLCSAPSQRAPGASPSAHNISSAAVSDRPNFSRGVGIRSTFHAGQQRGARDQQGSAYPGGPASPSLSHGNSQARRTHGATGIFSKFTSKFVRRWV